MAIAQADNFSIYGTDTSLPLDGLYAQFEGALATDPDGLSSGHVLKHDNGSSNNNVPWRYALQDGAETTVGIALRTWYSALPSGSPKDYIMRWADASNNILAYLGVTSTGGLSLVVNRSGGSDTYTTAVPAITASGWYHIEAKYTHSGASLCAFEVRVEGVTVLTQTGKTATDSDVYQCSAYRDRISNISQVYTKDLVIWTGSGTENTDFLGSVLVTDLLTTADVALNWVPSTGSVGWSILDNIPPVDTTYISANDTPPAAYVATLSDLPANVTSVKALLPFVRAAKSDGGDGFLQLGLISDPSGTPATALGTNRPITVAQTYWKDVIETDPKTSAAWLPAAVNDAELQINRTA